MLALFFALGRFLGEFSALAAFDVTPGWFLCVLGRSRLDFGGVRDAPPGRVLEAPRPYFSRFFGAHTLAMRKQPESHFVLEKPIRNACRPSSARCKKQAKFNSDACRTELSAKIALQTRLGARRARFWRSLGLSWVALGRHLAGFWELLGGSWPVLDTS